MVRACNGPACGRYSRLKTVDVIFPPGTPTLTAPASNNLGEFSVEWASVATAASYRLEERLNSGSWVQVQAAEDTWRLVSDKTSGTYRYRVRACNDAGCGPYSTTRSTAVTLSTIPPPAIAPSLTTRKPVIFPGTTIELNWWPVIGATSYSLHEQVPDGSWRQAAVGSSTETSLRHKESDDDYLYRVRACNSGGCGPLSNTVLVDVSWEGSCFEFGCLIPIIPSPPTDPVM